MKVVLCSNFLSLSYLQELQKKVPSDHTLINTSLTYRDYADTENFIFLYGYKINEDQKTIQVRTSLTKMNRYIIALSDIDSFISDLVIIMSRMP